MCSMKWRAPREGSDTGFQFGDPVRGESGKQRSPMTWRTNPRDAELCPSGIADFRAMRCYVDVRAADGALAYPIE